MNNGRIYSPEGRFPDSQPDALSTETIGIPANVVVRDLPEEAAEHSVWAHDAGRKILPGKTEKVEEITMTNIELVQTFIKEVFNAHDLSKLDEYMKDDYMQHSVEVEDGKEGFRKFAQGFFTLEPYMDVKRIFESDDNTVAVFFKCQFNNGHAAKVVDMYRIEGGKLAEHWDVVQQLTEEDAVNNGRGSF